MGHSLRLVRAEEGREHVSCACKVERIGALRIRVPCAACLAQGAALKRLPDVKTRSSAPARPLWSVPALWEEASLTRVKDGRRFPGLNPLEVATDGHFVTCTEADAAAVLHLLGWAYEGAVVLSGAMGLGKSHLAAGVAQDARRTRQERRFQVAWVDMLQLAGDLASNYGSERYKRADAVLEAALEADLTVLDGLGLGGGGRRMVDTEVMLVGVRYTEKRPVLVTTRLDEVGVGLRSPELRSYLRGLMKLGGAWLTLTGEDRRVTDRQRVLPLEKK